MAATVSDSIDIKASAADVFGVATDFESYPEWNPSIKKVTVESRDDEGRAREVWFEVDARVKVLRYTLNYDYSNAPDSFSWELRDGDVKELKGSYSFDEFDDVTEVTYETTIDPGFPVPGILKRQAEKQIVKAALQDLKKRVEA